MSKLLCVDCGTYFDATQSSCPNCGCPAKECEGNKETEPEQSYMQVNEYNENYYYVDFDWFEKFSSDPRLLKFLINVRFLKWLCAPWHISDKNGSVNHKIANSTFFIFNRFWKWIVYFQVWALIKLLPMWIVYFILNGMIVSSREYELLYYLYGFNAIWIIPAAIFAFWFLCIGFGKSCKRYLIPLIAELRRLYITVSKDIKNNI